jgi:hypothetical protein
MVVDTDGTPTTSEIYLDRIVDSSPGRPVVVESVSGLGVGVAWSRYAGGAQDLVLQRYSFNIEEIGDPVVVFDAAGNAVSPELAWDGSAFGVAWEVSSGVSDSDVMFSRVGCP